MRLRIDLRIFLFIVLFFITKQIKTYLVTMLFCVIHEFGHVLMGLLLGFKTDKIEITPFGLSVSFKLKVEDYNIKIKNANLLEFKKILIAMAGPITNLLMIMLFIFIPVKANNNIFITSNIAIMLFNLLPIYPLDGGRIIRSLICINKGNYKAKKIGNIISNIFMIILTLFVCTSYIYIHNLFIVIVIIFIWILVIKENIKYNNLKKILRLSENKIA